MKKKPDSTIGFITSAVAASKPSKVVSSGEKMYTDRMSNFRLTYDGPALESSEMDVRELAPALLAAGDLLDAATRVLNGERSKPQINVRGSFKVGSFGIDFTLVADWAMAVKDIFASDTATALANASAILGLLGFVGQKMGLLGALKWIRGRKITKVEVSQETAKIYVDEESIEVDSRVVALLRDLDVRESFDKLLAPLDRDGIDKFASGTDDTIDQVVTKEQRSWFHSPAAEDVLILEDTRKMAFSIVSLAFKEDNKWRLYDGSATIHATISDHEFIRRVDQNLERFAKGDSLICMVDVRQWQTTNGVRTDYDVTEVLEHRQASRQIHLPLN